MQGKVQDIRPVGASMMPGLTAGSGVTSADNPSLPATLPAPAGEATGMGTATSAGGGSLNDAGLDEGPSGVRPRSRVDLTAGPASGPDGSGSLPANIAAAMNSGGQKQAAFPALAIEGHGRESQKTSPGDVHAATSDVGYLPLSGFSGARLVQHVSGSEMQVSLHSDDLGRVTVHTAFAHDAISAQITLSNSQLGSVLSAHLPGMEQRLAQHHGLRASVTVDTQTGPDSQRNSDANGADQRGRGLSRGMLSGNSAAIMEPSPASSFLSSPSLPTSAGRQRLDVRI